MARQERLATLGQAVAGIGHDMRSLVTGIIGGVELLELTVKSGRIESAEDSLHLLRRTADKIEYYMTDLLTFAKEQKLELCKTDIASMLDDVLSVAASQARERGVTLRFEKRGVTAMEVDGPKLFRALLNLVKNGIEACRKGGGVVEVGVEQREGKVVIQVADTGQGIAPEDIPKLFDPFFTKKISSGTGLGLAIAHSVVEQHGGRINVVSAVGHGTRFEIFLPLGGAPALDQTLPGGAGKPSFLGKQSEQDQMGFLTPRGGSI